MSFGIWQLLLLLAVILVIFGPGKLPGAIKDIGKGIKSLKEELGKDEKENTADKNGDEAIIVNEDSDTKQKKQK